MRLRGFAFALSLTTLSAASAEAQGKFDVECPELDDESRAELWARAQAELGLRQTNTYASVVCQSGTVYLALVDAQSTRRSELPVADPDDGRSLKERILDRLGTIVAARARPKPRRPHRARTTEGGEPDVLVSAASSNTTATSLGVLGGAKFESWGGEALGSLGPRVGLVWSRGAFDASALCTLAWGLRSPSDLRSRVMTSVIVGDGWIDDISFGGGGGVRWVTIRNARTSEVEQTAVGIAMLRLRARFRMDNVSLTSGPEIDLASAAVKAELDGRKRFEIPTLTIGAAVELAVEL